MIDARGGAPLYQQVADALAERIESGEFPPGAQLPAEPDLASHYEVGKDTIRAALAELRAEGLIITQRGYRASVVDASDKADVWVEPGTIVESRPPTRVERRRLATEGRPVLPGWPVLHVIPSTESTDLPDLYPAHRYRVRVQGNPSSE